MDLLVAYEIRLQKERNAVPRITPKFQAEAEWLSAYETVAYRAKLMRQFGIRSYQVLLRWSDFLRIYYPFYPKFIVKAVQAIFKMLNNDVFLQTQTAREFQKSRTFVKRLLESGIDLSLIAFNPLQKTCPVHLIMRLSLIIGRYVEKTIRWTRTFFMPIEKQFSSVNVLRLLEDLPIEKNNKALIGIYLNQATV